VFFLWTSHVADWSCKTVPILVVFHLNWRRPYRWEVDKILFYPSSEIFLLCHSTGVFLLLWTGASSPDLVRANETLIEIRAHYQFELC
jgi:hypothetical protein